ncbi:MAG: hypothetical protein J6331_07765 [Lentisphaeria bacterium]|nr:hypothetical protein [Lentisphaeria bacterium]
MKKLSLLCVCFMIASVLPLQAKELVLAGKNGGDNFFPLQSRKGTGPLLDR